MESFDDVWERKRAALRSDALVPVVELRIDVAEGSPRRVWCYDPWETVLHVRLDGFLGSCRASIPQGWPALPELVQGIERVSALSCPEMVWGGESDDLQMRIAVELPSYGDNVTCDVWLRSEHPDRDGHKETYHLRLRTNLPWLDLFLADLRRLDASRRSAEEGRRPYWG